MSDPTINLDALETVLAGRRQGKWFVVGIGIYGEMPSHPLVGTATSTADAAAIVAAVNAVPALIAELRDLRAKQDAVRALAEEYRADGVRRDLAGKPAWPLNVAGRLDFILGGS